MANPFTQQYATFLHEQLTEVKRKLNDFLNAFALGSPDVTVLQTKARSFGEALANLRKALAAAYVPQWIRPLEDQIKLFIQNTHQQQARTLLDLIMKYNDAIQAQEWPDESEPSVSFDEIFENAKAESRVEDLYKNIIQILKRIIDDDEIDSLTVLRHLKMLMETLKTNQRGSVWSKVFGWKIIQKLLAQTIDAIKFVPGVKPEDMQELEKASGDLNSEIDSVQAKSFGTIQEKLGLDLQKIASNQRLLNGQPATVQSIPN